MNKIINNLDVKNTDIYKITLICDENILRKRLKIDGRSQDRIEDSIERQKKYYSMDTIKLDTTNLNVEEVLVEIEEIIEGSGMF